MRPSIADYAGAAIDVLDALGIERATVIGHHFFKQLQAFQNPILFHSVPKPKSRLAEICLNLEWIR